MEEKEDMCQCNWCSTIFKEECIVHNESTGTESCPNCEKVGYLMDLENNPSLEENKDFNPIGQLFNYQTDRVNKVNPHTIVKVRITDYDKKTTMCKCLLVATMDSVLNEGLKYNKEGIAMEILFEDLMPRLKEPTKAEALVTKIKDALLEMEKGINDSTKQYGIDHPEVQASIKWEEPIINYLLKIIEEGESEIL